MKKGIFLALLFLAGTTASAMPCDVSMVWMTCKSKTYTMNAQYCGFQNTLRAVDVSGEGLSALEFSREWDGAGFYGLQATGENHMIRLEINRQSKKAEFTLYTPSEEEDGRWTEHSTEVAQCADASDEGVAP